MRNTGNQGFRLHREKWNLLPLSSKKQVLIRFPHTKSRSRALYQPLNLPANIPLSSPRAHVFRCLYIPGCSASRGRGRLRPDPMVDMNPKDAKVRGIVHEEWVMLCHPRGAIRVRANLTELVPPGVVSMFHDFPRPPMLMSLIEPGLSGSDLRISWL